MSECKMFMSVMFALVILGPVSAQENSRLELSAMKSWTIVIPEDAIPSEVYAAEEFQSFFNEISKVKLPIARTACAAGNVFIGCGDALKKSTAAVNTADVGQEGFRIKITADSVAIAGGRPRGSLYGVYEFFEKYAGMRFLTKDHTYIPADAAHREIPREEFFFNPPVENRHSGYGETKSDPAFAVKLRCNTVTRDAKFGGASKMKRISHSFSHQIPSTKYGKEHPEYYCMVGGKRMSDVKGQDAKPLVGNEPCLTNPDVVRIVTAAVLEELKNNPDKGNVSVSQNDNFAYCCCPQCAAIDKREQAHSGTLLEFVNAVADEVKKTHPDVKVGTLIYQYTRKPPKNLKPRPNVQLQLCSIECSQVLPIDNPKLSMNAAFCKDLVAWSKICDNIQVWSYNTNFYNYLLPCPNLRNIEPNIRLFVKNNVRGIYMQGAANANGAEFSDLRNYVTSRLLWNPNLSGQELIDEFLDLHYGAAAPPIRQFINLVHDNAIKKGATKDCFATAADYGIDNSIAKAGLKLFDDAMKLAENDEVRNRVEKASICAYRAAVEDAWRWIWLTPFEMPMPRTQPMPSSVVKRTRPYASKLFKLCDKYGVTHWDELTPIEKAKQLFRKAYRLKDNEPI